MSNQDTMGRLRTQLLGSLLALPEEHWPTDEEDLFLRGLDSLRVVRLLVFVERQFGVRLPDEEITVENLRTIRSIHDWIATHAK